ncbi:hypothetical protein D3X26_06675 [Acinetobacter baumannii]|uniref:Uncharacterized protein n=1 Tax=Acinetobacter baumannii TaxID=470 RepID=A0A5N0FQX4_ACIBA|nr:hypothetical protein B7L46_19225 [Acinetobacter baumannii]EXB29989.1 hypothetical protein J518_2971 [Acinetobacter baumannii 1419130]RSF47432.1 hypothetical protein EGS71_03320 [Acinetobacter sp. FDAARGOS_559]ASO71244.1 hypothetical protein Aba7804_10815 [Acinetobacter baumannii]AVN29884.1 hypothetical protein AM467_10775 [Acinetobacter baumannii]
MFKLQCIINPFVILISSHNLATDSDAYMSQCNYDAKLFLYYFQLLNHFYHFSFLKKFQF